MLEEPTVNGLRQAIAEKFELDPAKISKVTLNSENFLFTLCLQWKIQILKKQKRGILVNMDDNIIAHYSHEDTFIIDFINDEDGFVKISLIEYVP